jgi:hypothetical protein
VIAALGLPLATTTSRSPFIVSATVILHSAITTSDESKAPSILPSLVFVSFTLPHLNVYVGHEYAAISLSVGILTLDSVLASIALK